MLLTSRLPAYSKFPPAIRSPFGREIIAYTASPSGTLVPNCRPGPSADHDAPSQRAMLFAGTEPPTVSKVPPTIRSPFGEERSERTTYELMPPLVIPDPSWDQPVPFQRATRRMGWPPDVKKE